MFGSRVDAVQRMVKGFILIQHMVNTIKEHMCNRNNRFFVATTFLNVVITDFKVRTLFTFYCSIRTLDQQGLNVYASA